MSKSHKLHRLFGAALLVALLLGVFTTARISAHGEDAGLVHACVAPSGNLRLEPPGGCPNNWDPIHLDEDWLGAGTGLMTLANDTDRVAIGPDNTNNGKLTVNAASGEEALRVRNDGTTSFVVDDEGQVGVGTAGPTARLQVHSGLAEDPLAVHLSGQLAPDFLVTAAGDVGIGQGSPTAKLEIVSPDFNDHLVLNRSGAGRMHVTATNPRGLAITDGANTFVQVRQSTGNVGIGTNNPQSDFHVSDGDFTRLRLTATSPANDVQMFVDARGNGTDRGQLGTLSNHDVVMFANSQPLIVLGRDGSVCIGNC